MFSKLGENDSKWLIRSNHIAGLLSHFLLMGCKELHGFDLILPEYSELYRRITVFLHINTENYFGIENVFVLEQGNRRITRSMTCYIFAIGIHSMTNSSNRLVYSRARSFYSNPKQQLACCDSFCGYGVHAIRQWEMALRLLWETYKPTRAHCTYNLWPDISNLINYLFALILILMIKSNHNFAHVIITK